MPNTIAGERQVAVRLIVPEPEAAGLEIRPQLVAPEIDQRTADPTAPRTDAGQAARAGATDQLQQEGLRLVVARVPGRDGFGPELVPDLLEPGVPGPPAGVLERGAPASRQLADVGPLDTERNAGVSRERPAEALVVFGGGPKAVVQVREPGNPTSPADRNSTSRCSSAVESGPPDGGHQHASTPRPEAVSAHARTNAIGENHVEGGNGAGAGT